METISPNTEASEIHHPDKGGSHEKFVEIGAAKDAALEELEARAS